MAGDDETQRWSDSDTVTVHRFQYLDRAQGRFVASDDYATEDAIREMGARAIDGTALVVHRGRVSWSGILKKDDR